MRRHAPQRGTVQPITESAYDWLSLRHRNQDGAFRRACCGRGDHRLIIAAIHGQRHKAGGGTTALFCREMCEVAVGSDQRPRAATACSSIFAPNGSAPAWKVSRAGALAGSGNCRRHQSLIPA